MPNFCTYPLPTNWASKHSTFPFSTTWYLHKIPWLILWICSLLPLSWLHWCFHDLRFRYLICIQCHTFNTWCSIFFFLFFFILTGGCCECSEYLSCSGSVSCSFSTNDFIFNLWIYFKYFWWILLQYLIFVSKILLIENHISTNEYLWCFLMQQPVIFWLNTVANKSKLHSFLVQFVSENQVCESRLYIQKPSNVLY